MSYSRNRSSVIMGGVAVLETEDGLSQATFLFDYSLVLFPKRTMKIALLNS